MGKRTVENVPLTIQPYRQLDLMRVPPEGPARAMPAGAMAGEVLAQ
ncbi:MAG: hypothetical protein ACRYFR_03610 [Janthinobacterium lividum]